MISDTLIFIFGFVIFGAWIVGTILEFRKMAKNPKKYQKKGSFGFKEKSGSPDSE